MRKDYRIRLLPNMTGTLTLTYKTNKSNNHTKCLTTVRFKVRPPPKKYKCDQGLLLCYAVRYLKARKSRLCLLLSLILKFFKKVRVIVKHRSFLFVL